MNEIEVERLILEKFKELIKDRKTVEDLSAKIDKDMQCLDMREENRRYLDNRYGSSIDFYRSIKF